MALVKVKSWKNVFKIPSYFDCYAVMTPQGEMKKNKNKYFAQGYCLRMFLR